MGTCDLQGSPAFRLISPKSTWGSPGVSVYIRQPPLAPVSIPLVHTSPARGICRCRQRRLSQPPPHATCVTKGLRTPYNRNLLPSSRQRHPLASFPSQAPPASDPPVIFVSSVHSRVASRTGGDVGLGPVHSWWSARRHMERVARTVFLDIFYHFLVHGCGWFYAFGHCAGQRQ